MYSHTHSFSVKQVQRDRVSNEKFTTVVQNFLKNIWGFVFCECTWFWTTVRKKACYLSYLNWNLKSERKKLFKISVTWTATAQSTTHTGNNGTWANLGDTGRAWIHKYTINMQTTRSVTQRARSSHDNTSIVLQLCSTLNQQLYQLTPGRSQCINNLLPLS